MAPAGLMASGMVPWLKPVDRTEYEAGFGLPPFEDRGSGFHLAILSRHQPAALKVATHPSQLELTCSAVYLFIAARTICNNGASMKLRTFFLYYSVAAFLLSGVFLCAQPQAIPPSAKTDDALELVKQGQKLNSEGKQDEALALYDRALQLSPDLFQADLAAGMALDLEGKYQQARQHLAKAIEEAPPASKVQALRTMAVS